ncbi:hypothetical protein Naga_101611g2 [Nannochloropsis gaditana]|uniref:Uncharacterized protein n=1 Tax=Nannochloropsis gaditana TaxID=72520 RepID=W7U142_9STRA|nr:hypothetical protein Naga_101611g2 [Nannochloropsis gaditana]
MMLHALALTLPFPPKKGPGKTLSLRTDDPFDGKYYAPEEDEEARGKEREREGRREGGEDCGCDVDGNDLAYPPG